MRGCVSICGQLCARGKGRTSRAAIHSDGILDGNKSYIFHLQSNFQSNKGTALARFLNSQSVLWRIYVVSSASFGLRNCGRNESASYHSFHKQLFIIRSVAYFEKMLNLRFELSSVYKQEILTKKFFSIFFQFFF